jgi:hypothetical protein
MTTQALVGTWKKCVLTALVVCLALALPVMAFTAQINDRPESITGSVRS